MAVHQMVQETSFKPTQLNTGALIIRIGFWAVVYYNYNKESAQ